MPVMLLMLTAVQAVAQDDKVSFTAQAPDAVVVGDRFRISYKINTNNAKEFRAPDMKSLSVLTGPSTSTQSRTTIVNGKSSHEVTITYTYMVVATEEGTVDLDGATILVKGDQYTSNKLSIRVLPQDQTGQGSSSGPQQSTQGRSGSQPQAQAAQGNELFMVATVDKTTLYEQEAVLLTYKVYVSPDVNLRNLSNKMPDIKNCHVQEVDLPREKQLQLEHYNGRNYYAVVWNQYVLFPQHSGEIEIPAIDFEAIVAERVTSNDIFDIFNGGHMVESRQTVTSRKINLNVKPLPQGKTDAFYGGVGDFSLSSTISSTDVTANDAVTIRVILSGTGNLKLIKTPEFKFPQDFDIYDPKVENKYSLKNGRQTGNKIFEYLVIPRHAGEYTIPALEFQYFDPKSETYKTLRTDEYTLNVARGQGSDSQTSISYVNKEDLKFVGQDVRFHSTPLTLKSIDSQFYGSALFYLCLALPLIILIVVVVISRKRIAEGANMAKVRTKKASSVATRRLKSAGKLMKAGRKNEFYDEMMRALSGYMGDKLAIPTAELSKDRIGQELRDRKVVDELVRQVIGLMDDCEYARYAPGDDTGRMDHLYEQAVEVIGKIENSVK